MFNLKESDCTFFFPQKSALYTSGFYGGVAINGICRKMAIWTLNQNVPFNLRKGHRKLMGEGALGIWDIQQSKCLVAETWRHTSPWQSQIYAEAQWQDRVLGMICLNQKIETDMDGAKSMAALEENLAKVPDDLWHGARGSCYTRSAILNVAPTLQWDGPDEILLTWQRPKASQRQELFTCRCAAYLTELQLFYILYTDNNFRR